MIDRYLLGQSSAEEQAEIEKRYFTDPDFLDQVIAAEDDLIDAYLRGALSRHDREGFEARFLSVPELRERVRMAEALIAHVDQLQKPVAAYEKRGYGVGSLFAFLRRPGPAFQYAMAAALLIVIAAGAWLAVENGRLRARLRQSEAELSARDEQQRALEQQLAARSEGAERPDEGAGEKPPAVEPLNTQTPGAPQRPAIAAFTLVPGLSRDVEGLKRLIVPQAAEQVRLQMSFEARGDYSNLSATLRRGEGQAVWSRAGLKVQRSGAGRVVIVTLPSKLLAAGKYTLTLSGTDADGEAESLGDYPFAVTRK